MTKVLPERPKPNVGNLEFEWNEQLKKWVEVKPESTIDKFIKYIKGEK